MCHWWIGVIAARVSLLEQMEDPLLSLSAVLNLTQSWDIGHGRDL